MTGLLIVNRCYNERGRFGAINTSPTSKVIPSLVGDNPMGNDTHTPQTTKPLIITTITPEAINRLRVQGCFVDHGPIHRHGVHWEHHLWHELSGIAVYRNASGCFIVESLDPNFDFLPYTLATVAAILGNGPDPEPEPTCFECGGEIHPETDQLFDEVLCEACHREAVSDHAYMFMEPYR